MVITVSGAKRPGILPRGSRLDLKTLRIAAVVNTASGSAGPEAAAELERLLAQASLTPVEVASVGPAEIDAALDRLSSVSVDLLVVIGGDGTIRTAAERCGGKKVMLMPLPGGTMNMLPKALYGNRGWQDALLATLEAPRLRDVSGGQVGPYRFFCAGIFGAPALWASAREAVREAAFLRAARQALAAYRRAFARRVLYVFGDTKTGRAEAVTVLCPLISSALPNDAPVLEAAALDLAGAAQAFHLAFNAIFSDWRHDPAVETAKVERVRLFSRGSIPAILDGEIVRLPRAADVSFVPHGFNALVPAS